MRFHVKRPPGGYKKLKATPDLLPPKNKLTDEELEELKLIWEYEQAILSAKKQQPVY